VDPKVIANVRALLKLNVSVAEILADNLRLIKESFEGNVTTTSARLLLEHKVCFLLLLAIVVA
jgi:hypothetical protein